jgi:hypothetical protein
MQTIVLYFSKMVVGGTETLIMRLMQWYIQHSYNVFLLTDEKIEDIILLKDIEKVNGGEYFILNKKSRFFYSNTHKKLTFADVQLVFVLSFNMLQFFKSFKLLKQSKYHCRFRYRIYIVHPYGSYMAKSTILLSRVLMILLINKKNIFFMDEEVFKSCVVYYKLKENNLRHEILRLPIIINNDISSTARREVVNILTITRFDFPFKAYALGLIDAFQEIMNSVPNITLTIIGYGEGESLIGQKIMELKKEVKEKITVINKVAYSEIDYYIDKCDVYVGMGTTILDAVNRNKITIIAVGYQLCDLAIGFFHENYTKLGEIYCDEKIQCYSRFSDLLRWVCSIDDDAFIEIENYSKSLLSNFYNIGKIAPRIAREFHKFSFIENILVQIMSMIYTEEILTFILYLKNFFRRS